MSAQYKYASACRRCVRVMRAARIIVDTARSACSRYRVAIDASAASCFRLPRFSIRHASR